MKMKMKVPKWPERTRQRNDKTKPVPSGGIPSKPARAGFNLWRSVGVKLFVIFFCSILVFVLFVGYFSYNTAKKLITSNVSGAALQTITQASSKMNLEFTNYENLSKQLVFDQANENLLNEIYLTKDDFTRMNDTQQFQTKLSDVSYSDNTLAGIYLISNNKQAIGYNGTFDPGVMEEAWYKNVKTQHGKAIWLAPRKGGYMTAQSNKQGGDSTADNRIVLAREFIGTTAGNDDGTLLLDIKSDGFIADLKQINLGKGGNTFLVDPTTNKIVLSADSALIGQASPVKLDAKKTGGMQQQSVNHQAAFVVYKTIGSNGWDLVSYVPLAVLTSQANSILRTTLEIAVIAAVIAVLIGLFVSRMIGTPLGQLRDLMRLGAQGNLKVRTKFRGKDEIGQVGSSFNAMMEQITLLVDGANATAQEVLDTAAHLTDASKKTALSAKEISMATEEIASGAMTLASEAERGNELTANIGSQMHMVVEANLKMGQSAQDVGKVSEQGTEYMRELIGKTSSTEEMTRSMVEKVDRLKESTTSIRKILEVLNNMTRQTNILSLNATIEAARAGAAGKGFMVVADEIRKLADQSRQSIDVVAQITDSIQQEIDETVSVLSEAYPIFQEQIASVKEADAIFNRVRDHMGDFIRQLDHVTGSIEQLEQSQNVLVETMSSVSAVSEESSATSEEVASLSSEQSRISENLVSLSDKLEQVSNSLKESLSRFEV